MSMKLAQNKMGRMSSTKKIQRGSGIANKIAKEMRNEAKKNAQKKWRNSASRGAAKIEATMGGFKHAGLSKRQSADQNFFAENLAAGMSKAKSKRLQKRVINKSYKASIASEKFKTQRSLARSAATGGTISKGAEQYTESKNSDYKAELAKQEALTQYAKIINGSQGEGNEAVNPNDKSKTKDKNRPTINDYI